VLLAVEEVEVEVPVEAVVMETVDVTYDEVEVEEVDEADVDVTVELELERTAKPVELLKTWVVISTVSECGVVETKEVWDELD
jgi:hypothetical protein